MAKLRIKESSSLIMYTKKTETIGKIAKGKSTIGQIFKDC